MTDDDPLRLESLVAQGGRFVDPATGGLAVPVQPATTYARRPDNALLAPRHGYSRDQNPTYDVAEDLLARLEGAAEALLFGSGMAAASAVLQALAPGDHVVAPAAMYWSLRDWIADFCRHWGLALDTVDMTDPAAVAAAVRPGRTRLVWVETPANPCWEVTDIAAVAEIAHGAGARLAVDNTVPTPLLTQPLALGADLVMHSGTKYLNGHGDVVAGVLATAVLDENWAAIRDVRARGGSVLGPFESWLLLRGLRTLFVRVPRQCESARAVAEALEGHPALLSVAYPGLASHPGHSVAARQMRDGFGGMLSVRVRGGAAGALAVNGRLELFQRATSLGGVESLVEHRASVEGPASPVPDDLLRLSVGLEHPDDLLADLRQALAVVA